MTAQRWNVFSLSALPHSSISSISTYNLFLLFFPDKILKSLSPYLETLIFHSRIRWWSSREGRGMKGGRRTWDEYTGSIFIVLILVRRTKPSIKEFLFLSWRKEFKFLEERKKMFWFKRSEKSSVCITSLSISLLRIIFFSESCLYFFISRSLLNLVSCRNFIPLKFTSIWYLNFSRDKLFNIPFATDLWISI